MSAVMKSTPDSISPEMKYRLRARRSSLAMSSVAVRFFASSMAASSWGRLLALLFFAVSTQ
jgi:hypothetical protein